ncbi:MAG UNVERIFIED_CONTAM: hypothetical protein LVQ98_00025 [Rickettsiaceae bacterium]|jgi:UDP-N-acetylmuramoyl-tripeptide--D-alanyl-D-alanine ligase
MKESLTHFKSLSHKYKIVILGDMRELGEDSVKYHTDLLPNIMDAKINKVHSVGTFMYELHKILPEE